MKFEDKYLEYKGEDSVNLTKLRSKAFFVAALLIMTLFAVGCQAGSQGFKKEDIVAKVNDEVISKDYYNKHLTLFKKNYEDMYGDKVWTWNYDGKTFLQVVQENLLEKLVSDVAIIQYLKEEKVEIDTKEIQEQYDSYMEKMKDQAEIEKFFTENGIDESFIKEQIKTDLYMNEFYDKEIGSLNLSDADLKTYYDQHQEEYRNVQVKASHILVDKEEEAKDIIDKINGGADFAEMAKEHSKDPGSAPQGGDLGYFSKGMMVPEFEEAAFSLKKGEMSGAVKSKYGYHIIKVFDTIDEMRKFEDVKEEIRAKMTEQAIVDKTEAIKKEMKIEKFPENIK